MLPSLDCSRAEKTYLGVIDLAGAEEGGQRVVAGDDEAGNVDEELAGDVEEDEEKVQSAEAEHGVDLGHRRLLLEVVKRGVLGQLRCGQHAIIHLLLQNEGA